MFTLEELTTSLNNDNKVLTILKDIFNSDVANIIDEYQRFGIKYNENIIVNEYRGPKVRNYVPKSIKEYHISYEFIEQIFYTFNSLITRYQLYSPNYDSTRGIFTLNLPKDLSSILTNHLGNFSETLIRCTVISPCIISKSMLNSFYDVTVKIEGIGYNENVSEYYICITPLYIGAISRG